MSDRDDEDREAILKRRQRFLGLALGGIALAATACGDDADDSSPMPCLSPAIDASQMDAAGLDATPQVCLTRIPDDAGLTEDGGDDSGIDADGGEAPDGSA